MYFARFQREINENGIIYWNSVNFRMNLNGTDRLRTIHSQIRVFEWKKEKEKRKKKIISNEKNVKWIFWRNRKESEGKRWFLQWHKSNDLATVWVFAFAYEYETCWVSVVSLGFRQRTTYALKGLIGFPFCVKYVFYWSSQAVVCNVFDKIITLKRKKKL